MKANKCLATVVSIYFLMHTFKIVSPINLLTFAVITQVFLKFGQFLEFSAIRKPVATLGAVS